MSVNVIYCGQHPHIGETLTINYLREHLCDDAAIVVNYYLPDPPGTLEIDLVVINRNGVYLLEVKHWMGAITAYPAYWARHDRGRWENPISSVEHKARVMHSFLDRNWGSVSAVGLVVLSKGRSAFDGRQDPNAHKVFGLDETLIKALTGRQYVHSANRPRLPRHDVNRLSKVLVQNCTTDIEQWIAGYRALSQQSRGHYVDIQAEDPEFPGRIVRIKQYDVPEIGSQKELEKAVSCFKRDMAALLTAGPHPNLLIPYGFHRDGSSDERYYLVMEWTGGKTLAECIAAGPISPAEQVRILRKVAGALMHCHEHRVIHRNLTPHAIYLTDDGEVKVGDFDFARMPTVTLSLSSKGIFPTGGRHLAPEVVFDVHDADERADIYSLGAVWYDMVCCPAADDPLEVERIAKAQLPGGSRSLLESMLVVGREERRKRLGSMTQVKKRLDKLAKGQA